MSDRFIFVGAETFDDDMSISTINIEITDTEKRAPENFEVRPEIIALVKGLGYDTVADFLYDEYSWDEKEDWAESFEEWKEEYSRPDASSTDFFESKIEDYFENTDHDDWEYGHDWERSLYEAGEWGIGPILYSSCY